MKSLKLKSPAKINLSLKVMGKIPKGYHQLETLFHRISLADGLCLTQQVKGLNLTCSDRNLSVGNDNLIAKAYVLLKKKIPKLGGVKVHLDKRIPIQGGLGGGSSNAAFFLLGMNRLFGLKLSLTEMAAMGKVLGADVPFFVHNVNQAMGYGRGDEIEPCPVKHPKWFILVLFKEGLSTRDVFLNYSQVKATQASLTKKGPVARIPCRFHKHLDAWEASKWLHNDLEKPAFRLNPFIQEIISLIVQLGFPAVGMSGSGPSVFAMLDRKDEAVTLAQRLRNYLPNQDIHVCSSF